MKIPFKIKTKNFRHTNDEKIHHQQIYTVKNVKGSHSGRRKTAPEVNMYLHKGMKGTENGDYIGLMYKIILLFKSLFKN